MGYEAGKGLGKDAQGRTTIIEARLRIGRGAIGAYGREDGEKKEERIDSEFSNSDIESSK
jgi:tuftelin-interacting protein 11